MLDKTKGCSYDDTIVKGYFTTKCEIFFVSGSLNHNSGTILLYMLLKWSQFNVFCIISIALAMVYQVFFSYPCYLTKKT